MKWEKMKYKYCYVHYGAAVSIVAPFRLLTSQTPV